MVNLETISMLFLISCPVILFTIAIITTVLLVVRRWRSKHTEQVLRTFANKRVLAVEPNANFFGQESSGYIQVRGNGILLVTEEELYFEMWMPRRVLHIPKAALLSVGTSSSHLGKTRGSLLLKVVFQNPQGEVDSAAWLVQDLHTCVQSLDELMSGHH
ncbi:MAG: hypothetical protein Q9O62_08555 [Ardenticatenia bacterium]|nr:hypothetical protein [Ardenticatenia bacterium]